jgi:nucleoside-diphosphate-sugar epimerase
MKIAILGARGFVGRNLVKYLQHSHDVIAVTRATVDLLDADLVKQYLEQNRFDVVVNAAAIMTDNNSLVDTRNNLGIFMNFYNNKHLFGKFINLASGAEFDRSMDISLVDEKEIFYRLPKDSYGFGQNIKSRLCVEQPNFYNLRIFNCFGVDEAVTRIFPRFISKQNEVFEIQNDRYFDYFSIQDLCTVVDSFIDNDHSIKDVNCVYKEKYKISQIIDMFARIRGLKSNYIVTSTANYNYTSSNKNLESLHIKLAGLKQGFKDYE